MASEVKKEQLSTKHSSRANEIVAVVLLTLTVLLFLSLVTYSPTDWSLNTSSAQKTHNWIGVTGAVASDLLFQTIGTTAYLLPFLLGLIAWRVFRSASLYAPLSRIVGYILFVLSASSLLSLFGFLGGLTGEFFFQIFSYLIGKIGTGIVLTALFLTAVLLITNLSYFSFLSNFHFSFGFFDKWRQRFRLWRERQKKAAEARMEKRFEKRAEKEAAAATIAVKETTKKPTISAGEPAIASAATAASASSSPSL